MGMELTNHKILIVDDEPSIVEVLSLYLLREGFEVQQAVNGDDALEKIRLMPPSLVVLDLMLPGIDGLEIMRRLRREGNQIPVIMLTARSQEIDRIYGLELGADDYVTKPFSPIELVARVKAVMRRTYPKDSTNDTPEKSIIGEGLVINPVSRTVHLSGNPIELTATEFNLLWFMASSPNQVFSRDQLLKNVWGFSEFVDPSTVTVHIRRLREKIEDDPSKPMLLKTVWGVGYKFQLGVL